MCFLFIYFFLKALICTILVQCGLILEERWWSAWTNRSRAPCAMGAVRREEVLREVLRAITTTKGKTCMFDVSLANIPLSQTSLAESRDRAGIERELVFRSLPLLVLNYTCVVSAQTFHVSL